MKNWHRPLLHIGLTYLAVVLITGAAFADLLSDARVAVNWNGRVRAYPLQNAGENEIYYSNTQTGTGNDIAVGDFDGDNDVDIATFFNDRIRVYDGAASMENEFWYSTVLTNAGGIVAGDFDGDGNLEIGVSANDRIRTFEPAGQALGAGAAWYSNTGFGESQGIAAGDFDGDGNLEIAASLNDRVRLFEPATQGLGANEYWYSSIFGAGTVAGVATGDFDGDGNIDIAASADNRLRYWEPATQASNSIELWYSGLGGGSFDETFALTVGDFDGDTFLEIAAGLASRIRLFEPATQGSNQNEYWYSAIFTTITDIGTGDIDGDGNLDIVAAADTRLRYWEPATQGADSVEILYTNTQGPTGGTATSLAMIEIPSVDLLIGLPAAEVEVEFTAGAAARFGIFGVTWSYDLEETSDPAAGPWLPVPDFTDIPGDNSQVVFTSSAPQAATSYRVRSQVR